MRTDDDLLGIFEIAELAGVSRQAVANWRTRAPDFPAPVAELQSGPVFRRDHIRRWLRKKKHPMANVIAMINLKGGVAKSTTSVAVAEFMSARFSKRVLVVDLDSQTNATVMLIGEEKWTKLNDKHHTLAQLFADALVDPSERKFDLGSTLQHKVSNVETVKKLDLLPSSLELIDVQDRLGSMTSGRFYSDVPTEILRRAIRPIIDDYDYVVVDCPPNLGIITLNGLRIASSYVIPTVPDILSTYGIPQILSRVKAFADNIGQDITPLGIAITKFRAQSTVHANTIKRLKAAPGMPKVFETFTPENNQIARSAEWTSHNKLRQKYSYQGQFEMLESLTKEIMEAAG